jgi:hypothetical protein
MNKNQKNQENVKEVALAQKQSVTQAPHQPFMKTS